MISAKVCVVLTCDRDGCPDGGWHDDDNPGPYHFDTEEEAVSVARDAGFLIVDGLMLCPHHSAELECERLGHLWEEWQDHLFPITGVTYRTRCCDHCDKTEYDPPFEQICVVVHAQRIIDQSGLA